MKENVFKFTWVSGDGGPLILMEQKYLANWEGSDAPSNGRVVEANSRWGLEAATDYDLACDVEDYLGLIDFSEGKALVLGGDELATTWLPLSENQEGILIRWNYGNSESEVVEFAKFSSDEMEKDENIEFSVNNSKLVLFAAAQSGEDEVYPRLNFNLSNGNYKISTIESENERTSVICHHFRKLV